MRKRIISKNKVITDKDRECKLIIELVDFHLITNTFVFREYLQVIVGESEFLSLYKNNYSVELTNEEIDTLLAQTNLEFDKEENKYIDTIKNSIEDLLLLYYQNYPPYNLAKNSFIN